VGPFGEFVIDPTSEAISVPASHTSGSVAMHLIATLDQADPHCATQRLAPATRLGDWDGSNGCSGCRASSLLSIENICRRGKFK